MPPPQLVLAEDGALLRDGLAQTLGRFGFDVVAAVANGAELVAAVDELRPDALVTDVRMPPGYSDEGLRAALELRGRHPDLAVLVLSQYVEQTYATELLAQGGAKTGYLLKDRIADVRSLVGALREIIAGGTVVDPEVVRRLLTRRQDPLAALTERERETLALMAEGRSNTAIAEQMVVTEATVGKHIHNVFDKLDLPMATEHHRRVIAVVRYLQAQHET